MTWTRWIIVVVSVCAAAEASAASPTAQLAGRFCFNWASDPTKARCRRVDGELLKTFESKAFHCRVTETTNNTTGAPAADCKRSHPDKDYLIFRTKALCEAERLAQAANGD